MRKGNSLSYSKGKSLSSKISGFFSKKFFAIFCASFVVVCIVLLLAVFSLNNAYNSLENNYNNLTVESAKKISSLEVDVSVLIKKNLDLNADLSDLQKKYDSVLGTNAVLNEAYAGLEKEALETISKIQDYEKEIQKSIEWFQANSTLDGVKNIILLDLKANCLSKMANKCEINLSCFSLVNDEFLRYGYKTDSSTSGSIDKLQSVRDFVKNGGGDCEDFSLLFKAEYNSLAKECSGKPIELFGWIEKKGGNFWANYSSTWYIKDAAKKYLEENNKYPVVVCGAMFDFQSNEVNGHCMVAFASKKIISVSDLAALGGAELVEPQNGAYFGKINGDSGIYLADSLDKGNSFIDTLITDNDFFLYRDGKWNSYAAFKEELLEKKETLSSLVG